jgi:N-carbamoyl-D-amino-acid hydrolase
MTRTITVGAAQLGPIARNETRSQVIERLVALLHQGRRAGADLVVFPELALTTFFPRWYIAEDAEIVRWFEAEMPGPHTRPLFDEARALGIGFYLGFAEIHTDPAGVRHRYNSSVLVERDGSIVGTYRKIHIPGHESFEGWRPFQHLERYYFEPGPDEFGVWSAFGGRVGMMLCNDRRWPESYRVMALQGVELILCGYNTPVHYAPDPSQDALAGFHNHLVMQAGAYQNGTWVVGVAKGGCEEGVESLAQSAIIAPSGQIVAQAVTTGDELVVARCDLDWCKRYTETLFDFDRYRIPERYARITAQRGVVVDPVLAGPAGEPEPVSEPVIEPVTEPVAVGPVVEPTAPTRVRLCDVGDPPVDLEVAIAGPSPVPAAGPPLVEGVELAVPATPAEPAPDKMTLIEHEPGPDQPPGPPGR